MCVSFWVFLFKSVGQILFQSIEIKEKKKTDDTITGCDGA